MSSPQPFISVLRSNEIFSDFLPKYLFQNTCELSYVHIYVCGIESAAIEPHNRNGTKLPTQQGKQNINYSRCIQQSYVNHPLTTAGLLCRGTPMGKKHRTLQIGAVCNLSCTSSGAWGLLHRANVIPETFVNVSKGDSLI